MKTYTGDTALRMRKEGRTYTTTEKRMDPWWGETTETLYWVEHNGKTYAETVDRDGWLVLTEKEG